MTIDADEAVKGLVSIEAGIGAGRRYLALSAGLRLDYPLKWNLPT